jgi:hypothetical protein
MAHILLVLTNDRVPQKNSWKTIQRDLKKCKKLNIDATIA